MNTAMIYLLISVLMGAVGQILLKKGMASMGPLTMNIDNLGAILLRIGINPYIIGGLMIYGASTVFWLFALSRVDLSYAYPFASLSYVAMLLASWQLFREEISLLRLAGALVVMAGVILISRS